MKKIIRTYEVLEELTFLDKVIYKKGELVTDPLLLLYPDPHNPKVTLMQTEKTKDLNQMGSLVLPVKWDTKLKEVDSFVHHNYKYR